MRNQPIEISLVQQKLSEQESAFWSKKIPFILPLCLFSKNNFELLYDSISSSKYLLATNNSFSPTNPHFKSKFTINPLLLLLLPLSSMRNFYALVSTFEIFI